MAIGDLNTVVSAETQSEHTGKVILLDPRVAIFYQLVRGRRNWTVLDSMDVFNYLARIAPRLGQTNSQTVLTDHEIADYRYRLFKRIFPVGVIHPLGSAAANLSEALLGPGRIFVRRVLVYQHHHGVIVQALVTG